MWRSSCGVIDQGQFLVSDKGTGQGQTISPLLANIYLHYGAPGQTWCFQRVKFPSRQEVQPPHRESSLGSEEVTNRAKRRQSDERAVTKVKRLSHLDLEKFFDRVNHDKLMGQVAKRVEDKRLLKLIRAFLNAGVMENGLVSPSVEGTPQGGPLSPLLSNLVLDEFDRELERRGHRFVRYADDSN